MLNVMCLLVLAGCSAAAAENWSAAIVVGARATEQKPAQGGLVGAEAKARCGGFGAAQAAEILGVAASAVTSRVSDVTPATKGCEFSAGDKKISFSLSIANSIEEAKRDMENIREGYVIAARAQEKATGKQLPEGAYSDILSVGDDGVWSVTNGAMAIRYKNLTIMVIAPSDKRIQAAIAAKILQQL